MNDKILALRKELDQIDRELLEKVADRMRIVGRIGAEKARDGRALFDRDREKRVRDASLAHAADLGVDVGVADQLMSLLLGASHSTQAKVVSLAREPKRILIVGGDGGMGRLFSSLLRGRGHIVDSYDLGDERQLGAVVGASDVVIISVPMSTVISVVRDVAKHMRPDSLLCDINSLKSDVCSALSEYGGFEAIGLHPMFGPSVSSMRRQRVVLCPVRDGALGEWLREELGELGAELIETTPENHDKMMSVVQVLVHFNTVVMGEALRLSGVGVRESLAYTSPIYRLEMAFVGRLFTQDPELYAQILIQNPRGAEMRDNFIESAKRISSLLDSSDDEAFVKLFCQTAEWFDEFGAEAMALSDTVIDGIVSRA